MKIKSSNITINVHNMDLAIAFYESIGFEIQKRWDNHHAQLSAPGVTIGFHPSSEIKGIENSGNVSIGFTTDDFKGAKSLLKELAIDVVERKEEGREFLHFNDPDGTALNYIDPKW